MMNNVTSKERKGALENYEAQNKSNTRQVWA